MNTIIYRTSFIKITLTVLFIAFYSCTTHTHTHTQTHIRCLHLHSIIQTVNSFIVSH